MLRLERALASQRRWSPTGVRSWSTRALKPSLSHGVITRVTLHTACPLIIQCSYSLRSAKRLFIVLFSRCTFSFWLFVTRYCQEALCGIFHHIDSQSNYATPALFLTNSGIICIFLRNSLYRIIWTHITSLFHTQATYTSRWMESPRNPLHFSLHPRFLYMSGAILLWCCRAEQ